MSRSHTTCLATDIAVTGGPVPSSFSGVYACLCVLEIEPRALSKYYNVEIGSQNSFYVLSETGLELTQASLDLTVLLF